MSEAYDLHRFLEAQEPVFEIVLEELRSGQKRSHWMWFVFPQIEGLGSSPTARFFALRSRGDAKAYLRHDILGSRLRTCTALVNAVEGRSASEIFGQPDDLKFRSSMTLFAQATEENTVFLTALARYFGGRADEKTMARLQRI